MFQPNLKRTTRLLKLDRYERPSLFVRGVSDEEKEVLCYRSMLVKSRNIRMKQDLKVSRLFIEKCLADSYFGRHI